MLGVSGFVIHSRCRRLGFESQWELDLGHTNGGQRDVKVILHQLA